jgi:hypothetical protein
VTASGNGGDTSAEAPPDAPGDPAPDAIRVVRGEPTHEELAALVVVLAAVANAGPAPGDRGHDAPPAGAIHSSWTDRSRLMSSSWTAGRGNWRASASRR